MKTLAAVWVATLTSVGATFLFLLIAARNLEPAIYGTFATIYAYSLLLSAAFAFGFGDLLVKLLCQPDSERSPSQIAAVITISCAGGVAGAALYLMTLPAVVPGAIRIAALLCAASIAAQQVVNVCVGYFQASGRADLQSVWQMLLPLLRLFLALVALALGAFTEELAYLIVFGSSVAVLAAGIYYIPKMANFRAINFSSLSWALKESGPFGIASLSHLIYFQLAATLVGTLSTVEQAAFYSIAFNVFAATLILPGVIFQRILVPSIHRAVSRGDQGFLVAYNSLNGIMLAGGVCVGAIVFFVAPWIIPMLFGERYAPAAPILQIFALCIPLRYLVTSLGSLLLTGKNITAKAKAMSAVALLSTILNIILIPRFGAAGAAVCSAVSDLVLVSAYIGLVRMKIIKTSFIQGWFNFSWSRKISRKN